MDEKKTLNGELNISSYLLAEGNSAGSVSGFRGMLTPQTTANNDDTPAYAVYNIEDTKLLQQISSTGNTMQDLYQGKVISTSSHMAFIDKEGEEFPINVLFDYSVRCTPPPSCFDSGYPSNEMLRSILKELKVAVDEGLISIGCDDDETNHEVTATKLCEENKRRLLGLEPDSSAIGTSDLIYGKPYRYFTNEAMTGELRQIAVELIKSRVHHDMETGNVAVIDTMPELPSLEQFDGDVMCEVHDDKSLLPYESTRSGKAKKFVVRGGKMVPTGQYPKFMTNPKHNKKQRRKK